VHHFHGVWIKAASVNHCPKPSNPNSARAGSRAESRNRSRCDYEHEKAFLKAPERLSKGIRHCLGPRRPSKSRESEREPGAQHSCLLRPHWPESQEHLGLLMKHSAN
jgi:hypothetical protein